MRSILSPAGRRVLYRFAGSRVLLGFDFDGTLAPIVGDDDTDEDVFALNDPARLLTIRVGPSRRSLASYYLRGQTDIDRLMRILLAARPNR